MLTNSKLVVAVFVMMALFSTILIFNFKNVDALKSKCVSGTQYGYATKNIVCGDKLCSELSDEERAKYQKPVETDVSEYATLPVYTDDVDELKSQIAKLQEKVDAYEAEQETVQANLKMFDFMDFIAFNNQNWELVSTTHAPDVKVVYANGHQTDNFEDHVPDMQMVFTYAPDTKIVSHPIAFGQGEWTAGTGIVEGTFTEPMQLPDGTFIEPTGEKFRYTMVTIAKWNEEGLITEEYLFWDNAEVMRQLGITIP